MLKKKKDKETKGIISKKKSEDGGFLCGMGAGQGLGGFLNVLFLIWSVVTQGCTLWKIIKLLSFDFCAFLHIIYSSQPKRNMK